MPRRRQARGRRILGATTGQLWEGVAMRKDSRFGHMLGGALCVALISAPGALAAGAPSAPSTYAGLAGIAPQSTPAALASPALASQRPRGARRIPQLRRASVPALAQTQLAPNALASPAGSLLENFNGVSSRDSA